MEYRLRVGTIQDENGAWWVAVDDGVQPRQLVGPKGGRGFVDAGQASIAGHILAQAYRDALVADPGVAVVE